MRRCATTDSETSDLRRLFSNEMRRKLGSGSSSPGQCTNCAGMHAIGQEQHSRLVFEGASF
eukprot:5596699-Pleurochrysis_carterae.AAC.2